MPVFRKASQLPCSAEEAFAWHERPGALRRLTPPWDRVEILSQTGGICDGDRVELKIGSGLTAQRWLAEHHDYRPPHQFADLQVRGPFASWNHTHLFRPIDQDRCELVDEIHYKLPYGLFGACAGGGYVSSTLKRVFEYRHDVTRHDLELYRRFRDQPRMTVLVSGASGLVGSALVPLLTTQGHSIRKLGRSGGSAPNSFGWDPRRGVIDDGALDGVDAVVHLAGENIAGERWTDDVKRRLLESRTIPTRLLCERMAAMPVRPKVLVCASAVGFYGDRGEEVLTEESTVGNGFLPEVAKQWEEACQPARDAGIRVVNLRIGVVLSPQGGALEKVVPLFRMGGGGVLGSGNQYWSCIGLDDLIAIIVHCLSSESVSGPVNAVLPDPSTNREFTKTLAAVVHRPALVPAPEFALRLAMGEMADALLLASCRVVPAKLLASSYQFRKPTLEDTLRCELGR